MIHYLPTCVWRWNRQSVPKRRHIKYRRRGITQKKTCNIASFIPPPPVIFILPIRCCLIFFSSLLCRVSFSNTTIEQFNTLIVTTRTDMLQHSILKTRCLQTSQRNRVGWGDICKYTQYVVFSSDTPQCTCLYGWHCYITSIIKEPKKLLVGKPIKVFVCTWFI